MSTGVPLVSILMCTRNRASFLRRACASVQQQDMEDWELIIIDDGSSDDTPVVVAELARDEPRVVALRNDPPCFTIAQASNWALSKARGRYVAILDDDDAWCDSAKLSKQVRFLEENPGYIGTGGGIIFVDENGTETGRFLPPEDDAAIREVALLSSPLANSTAIFRRHEALKAGGYDVTLRDFADWDFWLRMGSRGRLHNLQEYLAYYTRWSGGRSAKNGRELAHSAARIVDRHQHAYPRHAVAWVYARLLVINACLPSFLRSGLRGRFTRIKQVLAGTGKRPFTSRSSRD